MSALPTVGARVMCPFINKAGTVERIDRSGWAHVRIRPGWVHELPADELTVMRRQGQAPIMESLMLAGALFFAVLALVLFFAVPAVAAERIEQGSRATYIDEAGKPWRVTVSSIAPGAGSVPWAWATIDADPRRVIHVPVADLKD